MKQRRVRNVVIDCDPGCDDALALLYACHSPALKVLAVTTCCGNAHVQTTTQNARAILNLIGASSVPVYRGSAKPLRFPLRTAVVHGESGLGDLKLRRQPVARRAEAAAAICRIARAYPNAVTVIALGPLTNLAMAFTLDPIGFRLIKELVILGGTLAAPGNCGPLAEFNFFVDPYAAEVVMRSGVTCSLVVLDACYPIALKAKDFRAVRNQTLRRALGKLLSGYMKANWKEEGIWGAIMYDPVAVYCAAFLGRLKRVTYQSEIETKGKHTRGMLVIDRRVRSTAKAQVAVITKVSLNAFKRDFFGALNRIEIDKRILN